MTIAFLGPVKKILLNSLKLLLNDKKIWECYFGNLAISLFNYIYRCGKISIKGLIFSIYSYFVVKICCIASI